MFRITCIFFTIIYPVFSRTHSLDDCDAPITRGSPGPDRGFRYFYDKDLAMCFMYLYNGADEGANSFETESDCNSYCLPQDYNSCGANKPPTGFCFEKMECDQNSTCRLGGLGFGVCCDKVIEEQWSKDYSPVCPDGSKPSTVDRWWGQTELLGKSCEHEFCPENTTCHSGQWLSYCCQNDIKIEGNQTQSDPSPCQSSSSSSSTSSSSSSSSTTTTTTSVPKTTTPIRAARVEEYSGYY